MCVCFAPCGHTHRYIHTFTFSCSSFSVRIFLSSPWIFMHHSRDCTVLRSSEGACMLSWVLWVGAVGRLIPKMRMSEIPKGNVEFLVCGLSFSCGAILLEGVCLCLGVGEDGSRGKRCKRSRRPHPCPHSPLFSVLLVPRWSMAPVW